MTTLCESWNSNWMDGSCPGCDEGDLDDHNDADAFEAALEPLPTWDGAAYTACTRNRAADVRQMRQHESAKSLLRTPTEDHERVLNTLDLQALSQGPGCGGDSTGSRSSMLRSSKLADDIEVVVERPLQWWSSTGRSVRPGAGQPTRSPESDGKLTHVIRLHRTGSIVVERKGSPPSAPGEGAGGAEATGEGQHREVCDDLYAEEERFWQQRCPFEAETDVFGGARGEQKPNYAPRGRKTLPAGPSPGFQAAAGRAANYDYATAEATYRAHPQQRTTDHRSHPDAYCKDGEPVHDKEKGGNTPTRPSTRSDTAEDESSSDAVDEGHPGGRPGPQCLRRAAQAYVPCIVQCADLAQKHVAMRQRRSRLLRDAENVLQEVLESVEGGRYDEDVLVTGVAFEGSPSSRRTKREGRICTLRQKVVDVSRGKPHLQSSESDATKDRDNVRWNGFHMSKQPRHPDHGGDDGGDAHYDTPLPCPAPASTRRGRPQPLKPCASEGFGVAHAGDMSRHRQYGGRRNQQQKDEEEAEEDEEEAKDSAGRVVEMSRRIALRCLHLEQECLRRERSQTMLWQDQIRVVRQKAQEMARRAVRDERLRASQALVEERKRFEESERAALAELEEAKKSWETERETLAANLAAAKSELEKTRRLAREEAEAAKSKAAQALEKQRQDLQRGWAEEKGGLRRAADDALRRAVDGKARAEQAASLRAQTTQDSLNAQLRSWKSKAEAAARRAADERDKRRRAEDGVKGALAQEVDKARQAQESLLRDLMSKAEADKAAHAEEIARLKEEHEANLRRVHEDKKKLSEAALRQWQLQMQQMRADAAAAVQDAASQAAAERTEALRRLRLAHDVEIRKAGRDVLRLEREVRRLAHQEQQQQGPAGVVASSRDGTSSLSPLPRGSRSPKPLGAETGTTTSCLNGVEAALGSSNVDENPGEASGL